MMRTMQMVMVVLFASFEIYGMNQPVKAPLQLLLKDIVNLVDHCHINTEKNNELYFCQYNMDANGINEHLVLPSSLNQIDVVNATYIGQTEDEVAKILAQ